MKNLELENW